MKTTFFKTAFVLFVLMLNSCTSDDSSNGETTPTADATSFKLDGVLITADETKATYYTNNVAGGKYIDIYAFKAGKQVLELHFPATMATYPAKQSFDMTSSWLTYQANGGTTFPADYFHSTSGEMKVTTMDLTSKKIKGTFSFVGNNTIKNVNITEGVLVANTITVQ